MAQEQTSNGAALAKAAVTSITKSAEHETAISAAAAHATALTQAKFVMALQRPRDMDGVRVSLLKACKRRRFAETAVYSKPMGRGNEPVRGFSIRFAEEAARALGNLDIASNALYDDASKRIICVCVTDLESNTSYSVDVTVQKTVERRFLKDGQAALGVRTNSTGQTTYMVAATDDDVLNKQNALISKAVRGGILRVLPSDIREEAQEEILATMEREDNADPDAARKRLADSFAELNVSPTELKKYLGHELSTCSPAELADLRKVYVSIREGEATWAEHMKLNAENNEPAEPKPAPKTRSEAAKDAVKNNARPRAQEVETDEYGEAIPPGVGVRQPGQEG